MREEVFARLNAALSELAEVAGGWPTLPVVNTCIELFRTAPSEVMNDYGLLSPFKQCFFLLAMMASAPEPQRSEPGEFEAEWKRAVELLIEIYGRYDTLFFPATREELGSRTHEEHDEIAVALGAFLHQHNTSILATPEQVLRRVRQVVGPFDTEICRDLGISATAICELIDWVYETVREEVDWFFDGMDVVREVRQQVITEGVSEPNLMQRVQQDPRVVAMSSAERRRPGHPFAIMRHELASRFGEDIASAFWRLFVTARGSVTLPLYIDDPNPVERAPLIALDADTAVVVNTNTLATAAWLVLSEHLARSDVKQRYVRRRSNVLEDTVAVVMQRFLGTGEQVFRSVYETDDGHKEHDLVIVLDRTVLVIESKSTPLKPVFRNPKSAAKRLRHEFRADEGIQAGCDQAAGIRRRLIDTKETVNLYTKVGELVLTLHPADFDEVYCICITADDFGVLATDLTIFLEKPSGEPYPWVANAHDLESFLEALVRRGWEWPRFVQYLRERRELHGKVRTSDELEIGGVFIRHGSLRQLLDADADIVQLGSDTANVFDEIFIEKQGGPLANLDPPGPLVFTDWKKELGLEKPQNYRSGGDTPPIQYSPDGIARPSGATPMPLTGHIGRNEECPCGSGKKFKKCHWRAL